MLLEQLRIRSPSLTPILKTLRLRDSGPGSSCESLAAVEQNGGCEALELS